MRGYCCVNRQLLTYDNVTGPGSFNDMDMMEICNIEGANQTKYPVRNPHKRTHTNTGGSLSVQSLLVFVPSLSWQIIGFHISIVTMNRTPTERQPVWRGCRFCLVQMTFDEYRAQMSIWAILASPMIM
jgi:hypothetical protein